MRAKRAESTAEKETSSAAAAATLEAYSIETESSSDDDDGPPPRLVLNAVGLEDEATNVLPLPLLKLTKIENKDPVVVVAAATASTGGARNDTAKRSESAESFSPMPALSPAHSIQRQPSEEEEEQVVVEVKMEEVEEEEEGGDEQEQEEEEKAFVSPKRKKAKTSPKKAEEAGLRKVESSPALVRLEKEKKAWKKKTSDDAVPHVDPNAPKRNRSAYVHFIISRRSNYSKAVMSQRDINIALASDWQKLSDEARQPFHKCAEEEKKRYVELMDEYKKTDQHKEYQRRRAKFMQSRKRKHDDSDDDDGDATSRHRHHHQMAFPKTSLFCPLLNDPTTSSSSSASASAPPSGGGLQYVGPIFTPEFVAYNKARDSYRRQLVIERANVEHELEALREHDVEVKIEKQEERLDEIDEKIDGAMKVMCKVFAGMSSAKDHLDDVDSLTEWLRGVTRMSTRDTTKKAVREHLVKYCKAQQQQQKK